MTMTLVERERYPGVILRVLFCDTRPLLPQILLPFFFTSSVGLTTVWSSFCLLSIMCVHYVSIVLPSFETMLNCKRFDSLSDSGDAFRKGCHWYRFKYLFHCDQRGDTWQIMNMQSEVCVFVQESRRVREPWYCSRKGRTIATSSRDCCLRATCSTRVIEVSRQHGNMHLC